MKIYLTTPGIPCGIYILLIGLYIPVLLGEEPTKCPSLSENPVCPCYNFREGLFLECPTATQEIVKNALSKIRGKVQSLSIYDLENSITELKSDIFFMNTKIIHLQISQTNIDKIHPKAFVALRDSLESLSIVSSKLNTIPHESFLDLRNVKSLDLQLNAIEEIPGNLFRNIKLKKLNLKGNKISNISENAFYNLEESLNELDLNENMIKTFPLKTLGKLKSLTNLKLSWNKINNFPDGSDKISNLLSLDLSSNLLNTIKTNWFRSTPNLTTLILFSNFIKQIDEDAFSHLKYLEILDLSRNEITSLSPKIFHNNHNIRTIDLGRNHLHYVHDLFTNLTKITEIFLTENNILEISENVFKFNYKLEVLNLEHNAIKNLHENCFFFLHNVHQLHMGTNYIQKLPKKLFQTTKKLITLSLDNNLIEKLDESLFDKLQSLKEIRLQNNRLNYIGRNVFSNLSSLLELHLQNNNIQNIDSQAFVTLKQLLHVNLQGNQLKTIGDLFPYKNSSLVSLQLSTNYLSLIKNSTLRGQINVHIMWLSENNIKVLNKYLFSDLLNIHRMYLKSNGITDIENKTFMHLQKLKYLDLSFNKIKKITNETFFKLISLEELNLQKNSIEVIDKNAFLFLTKIKTIDLSENRLVSINFNMTYLPIKKLLLFNNLIFKIDDTAVSLMPSLSSLNISNNLISCDDISRFQIIGLKSLDVSSNNISYLNVNTFTNFPSLQQLSLDATNISVLDPMTFSKNQNLLRISLAFNNIRDLHKDLFFHNTILQEMSLKDNNFTDFPHVALFNISTLEMLDMCNNNLRSIDFFKFLGLQNLRILKLCNNRITVINGFNSPSLKSLLYINLSGNKLTILPPNFFQLFSSSLKEIDLSNNLFATLPSSALSDVMLPALTLLDMSYNPLIQLLPTHATKYFPLLSEFIITDTNLTIITSKDFENFLSLQKLNLSRNSIIRLSPGAFSKLHKLDYLDLSQNKLEIIPTERLQGMYSARFLNFSRNSLRELDEFASDLQALQKLDLSHNFIAKISKNIFNNLNSLTELLLNGNWLSTISPDLFTHLKKINFIDVSKNYFEVIEIKLLTSIETQVKVLAFEDNPFVCNCQSQDVWLWMQAHHKMVMKKNKNLKCEQPEDLHGYNFLELPSNKLCDKPIVIRVAVQDIQTYSVLVSWISRNQTGLDGYQIAFFSEHNPALIRGKTVGANSRTARLNHLTPGSLYTICVTAFGNFGHLTSVPDARVASQEFSIHSIFGDEEIYNNLKSNMNDSLTTRCTSINTIEIFSAAIDSPFSNDYMGIADILARRLSLVVGCCMGFIVFIVLVSTLGYIKSKKRPIIARIETEHAPPYISYDNFTNPNIEIQSTDVDMSTITEDVSASILNQSITLATK